MNTEGKIKEAWRSARICWEAGNFYEYLSCAEYAKKLMDENEQYKKDQRAEESGINIE